MNILIKLYFPQDFMMKYILLTIVQLLQRQLVILAEILAWGEIFYIGGVILLIMECQDLKLFHQLFMMCDG